MRRGRGRRPFTSIEALVGSLVSIALGSGWMALGSAGFDDDIGSLARYVLGIGHVVLGAFMLREALRRRRTTHDAEDPRDSG